jgi:hypothetical protein
VLLTGDLLLLGGRIADVLARRAVFLAGLSARPRCPCQAIAGVMRR